MRLDLPSGAGLLLTGTGVYWVLSSSLISSFSVLAPGAFRGMGFVVVLAGGIMAFVAGVWTLRSDFSRLLVLVGSVDGWLFTLPLLLASSDVSLTVIGLTSSTNIMELNTFVAGAVQAGGVVFFSFVASYMILSEGVTLLMVALGNYLVPSSHMLRHLPYSMVCGAASFSSFSNILLLTGFLSEFTAFLGGATGAALLGSLVYRCFRFRQI